MSFIANISGRAIPDGNRDAADSLKLSLLLLGVNFFPFIGFYIALLVYVAWLFVRKLKNKDRYFIFWFFVVFAVASLLDVAAYFCVARGKSMTFFFSSMFAVALFFGPSVSLVLGMCGLLSQRKVEARWGVVLSILAFLASFFWLIFSWALSSVGNGRMM